MSKRSKEFHIELINRMLVLATSGFGFVSALAWNEAIQEIMKQFIESHLPALGFLSKLIYALIVTAVAVLITYQLSVLSEHLKKSK